MLCSSGKSSPDSGINRVVEQSQSPPIQSNHITIPTSTHWARRRKQANCIHYHTMPACRLKERSARAPRSGRKFFIDSRNSVISGHRSDPKCRAPLCIGSTLSSLPSPPLPIITVSIVIINIILSRPRFWEIPHSRRHQSLGSPPMELWICQKGSKDRLRDPAL